MRAPKRSLPLLGCLGLTGLLLIGTMRALRLPASPLDGAQTITQTTHWSTLPIDPYEFPFYSWSNGNDLTYAQKGGDGVTHLFRRPGTAHAPAGEIEGPVVQLSGGYPGTVSPDGKWFVEWHQNNLRQRVPTFVAMDGTQRREGKATWSNDEGVWTPTADAMVMGVWRNTAAIDRYRPDSGAQEKVGLPGLPGVSQLYEAVQIDASGHLIGVEDGSFMQYFEKSTGLSSRNYPNITLARFDLNDPTHKPEQWTAAAPKEIEHGYCLFSPSGDPILWVVYGDTTPPFLRILRRYVPGTLTSPKTGYRWLVSGIHGEQMQEIASFRYDPSQPTGPVRPPYSSPVWTPDGRNISFISHDTLYTRPIE